MNSFWYVMMVVLAHKWHIQTHVSVNLRLVSNNQLERQVGLGGDGVGGRALLHVNMYAPCRNQKLGGHD